MRPTPTIKASGNYIFKVTNLLSKDIIIPDLGGIRLRAKSTTDLGKKFDLEQIKKSRALAEQIWNGDIWAWDTKGNQIGGWDLCDVETNLLESGSEESSDMAIVCLSGCATDVISDYVALTLGGSKEEIRLINIFQEQKTSKNSPEGVWFALPSYTESSSDVDLLNPPTNYLRSLNWGNLYDIYDRREMAEAAYMNEASRRQIIYMLDRKTEKFYILQEGKVDLKNGEFCYIRKTLKNQLCGDCEKTTVVFGTNVPDACDTYLYNNFGVSSNISPYLVTGPKTICGLTLSYQSASLRDGRAVNTANKEIFSSYRLWIETDGIREFYIPLPGGDWQGRYLDLCNPSPLNVVEFFEGRSKLWNELSKFYEKWKEKKEKVYNELIFKGCILGIYLEGEKGEAAYGELPSQVSKYVVDETLNRELFNKVQKELSRLPEGDIRREGFMNLFSTGNPFYDRFIQFLYLIQTRSLFNADKISVYVDCNDDVKGRQELQSAESSWSDFTFCNSITNINLNLILCDVCDLKPLSEIDGRIWGKITDADGLGISGAEVTLPKWKWTVRTDYNGNYIFFDVLFGDAGYVLVKAEGYEEYQSDSILVTEEVPSVELNLTLNPKEVIPNYISGYIRDINGNGIKGTKININANTFSSQIGGDENGFYEYQIPGNTPQMIEVYASAEGYSEKGASGAYNGSDDVTLDINLQQSWTLTVDVRGGNGEVIDSTVYLERPVEFMPGMIIWTIVSSVDINNGRTTEYFYNLNSSINPCRLRVAPSTPGYLSTTRELTLSGNSTENFGLLKQQVTLNLFVQGQGSITGDGTYDYGTPINITATPSDGYTFVNWTRVSDGSEFGSSPAIGFTINEDLQLNANFAAV